MKIASADAAAGPPKDLPLQIESGSETRNLQIDDRPLLPQRECIALKGNTISDESGYYYPTGYVHPNTKPLKSCLSNSNLTSMSRIESAPNLSSMSSIRRNVSFHKVEIREYERAVGDHPCATGGTSLSLGWNYNRDHTVVDFEPYEEKRLKRSTSANLLPVPGAEKRRILIEEADATQEELLKALRKIVLISGQRKRTTKLQKEKNSKQMEMLEESFQNAKRKMRRILSGTSKAKEEKKLWKNAEKALQKRNASLKIRSNEDVSKVLSSANVHSGKLTNLSSEWSITSFSESEEESSFRNGEAVVSSSVYDDDTSSGDDWEFSYDDNK